MIKIVWYNKTQVGQKALLSLGVNVAEPDKIKK